MYSALIRNYKEYIERICLRKMSDWPITVRPDMTVVAYIYFNNHTEEDSPRSSSLRNECYWLCAWLTIWNKFMQLPKLSTIPDRLRISLIWWLKHTTNLCFWNSLPIRNDVEWPLTVTSKYEGFYIIKKGYNFFSSEPIFIFFDNKLKW